MAFPSGRFASYGLGNMYVFLMVNRSVIFGLILLVQEMSKVSPLVVIAGFIHDVTSWIDQHPGGRQLLSNSIGQDATTSFFGGVYNHSSAAHNVCLTFPLHLKK